MFQVWLRGWGGVALIITLFLVFIGVMDKGIILFSYAYYLGVLMVQIDRLEKFVNNDRVLAVSFVAFLCLCGHWVFGTDSYIQDIYKVIISLFACITFLNVSQRMKLPYKVGKIIRYFGRCSLPIYLIHFYFSLSIGRNTMTFYQLPTSFSPFIAVILAGGAAVIICCVCCLIYNVVATNKILRVLFFGK